MKVSIEWIPCAERLPDDDTTVLVAYDGEVWTAWHDDAGWQGITAEPLAAASVSHWAHLPEVPAWNPVLCDYCGQPTRFLPSSASIYHGRDYGPVYRCDPCDAHVGVHKGTTKPLGRLANAELRALKREVHRLFDPLWILYWQAYPDLDVRNSHMRNVQRGRSYAWLAEAMSIPDAECHVGMFTPERCREAIRVLNELKPTPKFIREWAKAREAA